MTWLNSIAFGVATFIILWIMQYVSVPKLIDLPEYFPALGVKTTLFSAAVMVALGYYFGFRAGQKVGAVGKDILPVSNATKE